MADFFTSDTHFGHKNVIKFNANTRKNHLTIEEHDEELIELWNSQVTDTDNIYILGDMFLCSKTRMREILPQLNGRKFLIKGNHDNMLVKDIDMLELFEEVTDYKIFRKDGHRAVLFHFPIYEWDGMHRGHFHLHGHTHGSVQLHGRSLDVGIDNRPEADMLFWKWEEIVEFMEGREIQPRSHVRGKE